MPVEGLTNTAPLFAVFYDSKRPAHVHSTRAWSGAGKRVTRILTEVYPQFVHHRGPRSAGIDGRPLLEKIIDSFQGREHDNVLPKHVQMYEIT